ncbi:FAST kinase domain-containing protein 5, mitochondrial [Frieseomelitta varia]|uniref:FAST kinase domain-containing protein 5, mitochondrial n=1 Tax=Frieseomelitta varia TaxID=561572 RepID=UPI001CB67FC7|nr:FAST kinase domain-containing protein 5, mitochondrial [Frieseomelitta varia]
MTLRLCNKLNCISMINHTWALKVCPRFIEKCKYFISFRTYKMVAVTDIVQNDSTKENMYIPEHKIIRSILQESTYYDKTIFPPIKTTAIVSSEDIDHLYTVNWFHESPNNIINAIKKLTYSYLSGTHLEIPLYDSIFTACTKCLPELQDQQIKILLQCSIALQEMIIKTICYKKFIKTLNTECIKRFYGPNVEEILLIIDAFYQLDPLNSDFLWRAMRKLATKVYKLSAKSLVQLFFVLPVVNISSINMYELECRVQECMCDLTGDELGIIARGFFRKKRRIQNRLLMPQIMAKTIKQIDIIDDTSLASIMKLIRYSDCQHCLKDFQELLLSLRDEIPRLSLKCLIHTTHTFGSLRIYDEILTNKILQRLEKEMKTARLKDIERVIYSICTVAPITDYYTNICHKFVNEMMFTYNTTRAAEINRYPISLIRILTFLTIRNIYVPELLEFVFEPNFVKKTYNSNLKLLTNEWLMLHCSVKIDLAYYKGPLLENNLYTYLIKQNCNHEIETYKQDVNAKLRMEIAFICKNKLGIELYSDYILPHYLNKDIIFGLDTHNNPVEIGSILSAMPLGSIKNVDTDELKNIKWKVLVPLSASVKVANADRYIGYIYRKWRHLRIIGYTPIPICENIWECMDEESKAQHLRQLIYEDIQSNLFKT